MPLYEYQCDSCANRFERIQKYSDPLVDICPACGGPVKKLLSSPAIQFKGSGWYVTDYGRKQTSNDGSSKAKAADSPAGGAAGEAASNKGTTTPAPAASTTTTQKSE